MENDDAGARTGADGHVRRPLADSDPDAIDAVFDALAHERRRVVLRHVIDLPGWVGLDELADDIHDRGNRADGDLPGWDGYERIRCTLYHNHLPKLDHAGIVEFDRSNDAVRPSPDGTRVALCRDLMAHAGG